jgi:hemolysin III
MHFSHTNKSAPVFARSLGEEIANAILHGIGALAACGALVFLTLRCNGLFGGDAAGGRGITAGVLFTATMILMFGASTLYHALTNKTAKRVFKSLDHGAIYLFIAGTYTPFCLLVLPQPIGYIIFILEWACAASGILFYSIKPLRESKWVKRLEMVIYLLMGWAIIASAPSLRSVLPPQSLVLLIAGGLCYTGGVFAYVRKTKPGAHIVWHVCVLCGAAAHYGAVWFLV